MSICSSPKQYVELRQFESQQAANEAVGQLNSGVRDKFGEDE